jgi:hypothetical protein
VDVTGIADNTLQQMPVCPVSGHIQTQHEPIIGVFHKYAHQGTGKTIHLSPSCVILAQLSTIPFVFLVVNNIWKPWMDTSSHCPFVLVYLIWICPHLLRRNWTLIPMFSSLARWNYTLKVSMKNILLLTWTLLMMISNTQTTTLAVLMCYGDLIPSAHQHDVHLRTVQPNQPDLATISPNFGGVPRLCIQHTLDPTTQFTRLDTCLPLQKHFKSRFPAANVSRINEVVATNTNFSDTPALDNGIMGHGGTKMVQLFCGCSSLLTAVYPMWRENNIASTLEDFIRHYGAPNALFIDNAKSQIGCAVQEILHMYAIKDFQCEPHHQHWN